MSTGVDIPLPTDLEVLEEIAAQATRRVNEATHRRGGKGYYAFNLSPNLEHTHVPHSPKPMKAPDTPASQPASPSIAFSAAEVTSYTELMSAIQTQVGALGLKLSDFDDLAGFPAGLSGKVFGLLQVKRLGPEKMFDAIRAAGLRIRVEVDPEQAAKMAQRISENYNPRQANQARLCHSSTTPSSAVLTRVFKAMGRTGGKARWSGKSKSERAAHGKLMVMAREKKRRMKAGQRRRLKARQREKAAKVAAEVVV